MFPLPEIYYVWTVIMCIDLFGRAWKPTPTSETAVCKIKKAPLKEAFFVGFNYLTNVMRAVYLSGQSPIFLIPWEPPSKQASVSPTPTS